MTAANGALADIVASGARILESACGFCMGAGQAPQSGGVSVRTSNRNFKGRSGTQDARVYLVSPETAAVAALTGCLADPSEGSAVLGIPFPDIALPESFMIDDVQFQQPTFNGDPVRGPNIGPPPSPPPPVDVIHGAVAAVYGDDITTDHILPAGSLLKYRSNIAKYSEYVFHHIDPEFPSRCGNITAKGKSPIIVAGLSYGQGSSREHAAVCPMHLGVRAVIAKSMERIHRANLINFGILPLFFADQADYDTLTPDDELEIADILTLIKSGRGTVRNITRNTTFRIIVSLSERQKNILRCGSLLKAVCEGI
jgi:aconitate hydratase